MFSFLSLTLCSPLPLLTLSILLSATMALEQVLLHFSKPAMLRNRIGKVPYSIYIYIDMFIRDDLGFCHCICSTQVLLPPLRWHSQHTGAHMRVQAARQSLQLGAAGCAVPLSRAHRAAAGD